jgi:hypothetical protein
MRTCTRTAVELEYREHNLLRRVAGLLLPQYAGFAISLLVAEGHSSISQDPNHLRPVLSCSSCDVYDCSNCMRSYVLDKTETNFNARVSKNEELSQRKLPG